MKNKVQFYRQKRNLTQTELVEKSGVSLRTIQRIERGSSLKGFTLESLANALEVKPENLIDETIDIERIKIINLVILAFLLIPFGNIIFPIILTFKSKNEKTKSMGKDIVSVQIIWTLITCILLIISPFIQHGLQIDVPLAVILLVILMGANVFIVFKNSIRLTNKSELYITSKFKLL